jgi:hypothetical protein
MNKEQQEEYDKAVDMASKAKMLLDEHADVIKRMTAEFPPKLFGLNGYQRKRESSIEKTIERVTHYVSLPDRLIRRYKDQENNARELEKRKAAEDAMKQKEIEAHNLTQDAVLWIQEHHPDKKIGVDFDIVYAVEYANRLAFDAEVERIRSEREWHEFAGFNCYDVSDEGESCAGWDGASKRCQCGNRRVDWVEGYGHSFKEPYVCAEAY